MYEEEEEEKEKHGIKSLTINPASSRLRSSMSPVSW